MAAITWKLDSTDTQVNNTTTTFAIAATLAAADITNQEYLLVVTAVIGATNANRNAFFKLVDNVTDIPNSETRLEVFQNALTGGI